MNKLGSFSVSSIRNYAALSAIALTLLVTSSAVWNIENLDKQAIYIATEEARANWNKDQAFRRWATRHGGLYVKPNERTPPNPYLQHVPNRDVQTTDGVKLTLMNPAYMMSQMTKEFESMYGIKGKITGQILLNPANKADPWQLKALKQFDKGLKEVSEQANIDGQPFIRLMRPMVMKKGCLLCHGHLGFKVGDIRGGVSISIPLTPYFEAAQESKTSLIFTHSIVWSIGMLTIGLVSWRGHRREREKRHAEEERQKIQEKLRHTQKLESLGVLAGGIAHDFNNILTSILGNTDLALDDLSPASPAHDFIEEIQKGAKRAAELSHQMLAYSGKGKFIIKNIDVNDIIKEMTHMLEVSISKKHNIKYDLTENLLLVEVDITQIHQVIMNLIINASEAIGENNGVISVSTSTVECGGEECQTCRDMMFDEVLPMGQYVVTEVADTGIGMDEEIIKKIFDPFFTTKLTGRGLGMSVVLGIIRGHKGAINVESEPGVGTKFTVFLPVSGNVLATTKPGREETAASWRGHGTVLLVDDDETVREVGKDMLEAIGFNVTTAVDGQEAVQIFHDSSNEIDCVLLDLTMPLMNGEECFHELRKIWKDIRVVIYSGYSKEETAQKFVDQGVNEFLQKPFGLKALKNTMRKVFVEDKI
jgi:signal transduction histidine kinase/ActR/RegA family two-component response regulator